MGQLARLPVARALGASSTTTIARPHDVGVDFVDTTGHATEAMQQRYSTVALEEMRESIGKVISMAKMKEAMAVTSRGGVQGGVRDAEKRKAS